MSIENIRAKLLAQLNCHKLEIIDQSALHANHYENKSTSPSHLKIIIDAVEFNGLNRVACHKMINQILKDELNSHLHALSISIK